MRSKPFFPHLTPHKKLPRYLVIGGRLRYWIVLYRHRRNFR